MKWLDRAICGLWCRWAGHRFVFGIPWGSYSAFCTRCGFCSVDDTTGVDPQPKP